ncbi:MULTISPECIES: M13 family metallopeptidase [Mycobacterium]|uniref:Peptidase M13 n=1 Tax=Mycobacterium kiyosense TaxID=2871094 RepID=A0A9P3QAB5_9MYCO|nr:MULTISPECIES: M13 family metallopeptidase [Mycobacterium]BDE12919.1 peptidase M13 [Mycobacterium sp. 20KCMC460]GLB91511.1 peptidase M13 [Mycobacterium kiyosense]GLB97480.1 peptidase M13 [Mycobacterium kiyosense]GLC10019.1 peptidase M13 [Mycobacterium kiyosense]GLC15820.1 peptidase M13 [Mycobacterium kiyosense]
MRVFVRTAAVPLAAALVFVGCSHKTEQPPKPKVGSWGVDMTQMDTSVRPGNDFFAYAVGSWVKNAKIPADKVCAGVNLDIQNQLNADLRAIVEGAAAKHAPAGDIAQQIGDLFASYMDEATLNKNGVEPVRPLLASIDAVNDRVALNGVLVSFNGKTRVDDPFPVSVDIDPNNPTRYLPNIWQGGLSLGDRGYYVNTDPESVELRNKFVAHVARLLGLAGYTDSQQQAERLLALETKLAQVQLPREDARNVDKTNNIMPRADVEQLGQGAPLHDMFEALKLPANIDFRVGMPDVLRQTAQLFATEPLDSWQAYMRYQVLDAYGGDLSTPFADELFDFYGRTMGGAEERAPRVERGVTRVSNGLGDPVGELYVGAHFSQQTRDKARALVENLRKAYSQRIDAASWMAPETKKEAQAKLAALVAKIGYPDHWKFYASVKISAADLIGNDNALAVWSWNDDVSKLPKPIDRTEWDMTPQTNNAYYSPRLNDIVFPAAILQPPNFDPAADPAANYGAIGATIGHEMSHAFDDQGRKSDGTGMQRDWWTPADAERYVRESNKLVAQFNGYEPLPGNHINGAVTLGENTADLAGLRIAYDAYKLSLGGKEAPKIDGLTGDQRFFLAFAASWREICRPESERNQLLSDVHSPAKFRVNGIVRNMDEWYAAFNVQPGDALYLKPEDRVRVW